MPRTLAAAALAAVLLLDAPAGRAQTPDLTPAELVGSLVLLEGGVSYGRVVGVNMGPGGVPKSLLLRPSAPASALYVVPWSAVEPSERDGRLVVTLINPEVAVLPLGRRPPAAGREDPR